MLDAFFPLLPSASAQESIPESISDAGCRFATGDITWNCIPAYVSQLTFVFVSFTASLCLLLLMVNGFRYMLGGISDELGGGAESAKKGIRYALVGFILSLLIYIIIETIVRAVTETS